MRREQDEQVMEIGPYGCTGGCNVVQTGANDAKKTTGGAQGTGDVPPAWPVAGVAVVAGVADGPEGASYTCESERPSGIIPLPGILSPEEFARTGKDMGACAVCGKGRVAWWSEDGKVGVCEGCYVRLLRDKNRGEGVV